MIFIGLYSSITALGLKTKVFNALRGLGVSTVEEFLSCDVSQAIHLRGTGRGTVKDLYEAQKRVLKQLQKNGVSLTLNTSPDLWAFLQGNLSVRVKNIFNRESVKTIEDFMSLDRERFLLFRSAGEKSWNEVQNLQKQILRSKAESPQVTLERTEDLLLPLFIEDASSSGLDKSSYSKLEDFPLWTDLVSLDVNIPSRFFPNQTITEIATDSRCKKALSRLGLFTLGETLSTPSSQLLELRAFGKKSLNELRLNISDFLDYQSNRKKEVSSGNSFVDFLFTLCQKVDISDDYALMIVERLTGKNNTPCTLEELGVQYGVTRERIRQILKENFTEINKSYRTKSLIGKVHTALEKTIRTSGGIVCVEEAMTRLASALNWVSPASEKSYIEYMRYVPLVSHIEFDEKVFLIEYPCRECRGLSFRLKQLVTKKSTGKVSFDELEHKASSLCVPDQETGCPEVPQEFSKEFWRDHARRLKLNVDTKGLFTDYRLKIREGGLEKKVEGILYTSPNALTPDEVCHRLEGVLEESFEVKKIHRALICSTECIVWGRGEFLHIKYIDLSNEVLNFIFKTLEEKLQSVPFLAVKGVFDEFSPRFKSHGISNEYALASVIDLKIKDFHIDRYRYIRSEKPKNTTPIDNYIEQWIFDAGKAIRYRDLEQRMIREIGLRQSLVDHALGRMKNVISLKRDWLIHVNNLKINRNLLIPLCHAIDKRLERYSQAGLKVIFKQQRYYLSQFEINDVKTLYGVLKYFYSDVYQFPAFLYVSRFEPRTVVSQSNNESKTGFKKTRQVNSPDETEQTESLNPEYVKKIKHVLSNRFSNGYRFESLIEQMRFRSFFKEDLGETVSLSDGELKRYFLASGTRYKNKIYPVPAKTEQEILKRVNECFKNGDRIVFYTEFFKKNREWLTEGNIESSDMLSEYLRRIYPDKKFTQTYFGSITDAVNEAVSSELSRVWGHQKLLTYEQLSERLLYVPLNRIKEALSRSNSFVCNSRATFLNVHRIEINGQEAAAIIGAAHEACTSEGYVLVSDLPVSEIGGAHDELSDTALYDAIYYRLLSDLFTKRGQVISYKGNEFDPTSLLSEAFQKKEMCLIEDLIVVQKQLTGKEDRAVVMKIAHSCLVRTDAERYMAEEYVDFDVEMIDEAIESSMEGDYLPLKAFTVFATFPFCGQTWNLFLLESYSYRFSKKFRLDLPSINNQNIGVVIRKDCSMNYHEVMGDAVLKAGVSLERKEVGDFLWENGYIGKRTIETIKAVIRQVKNLRV